jgi:hypothetical protein
VLADLCFAGLDLGELFGPHLGQQGGVLGDLLRAERVAPVRFRRILPAFALEFGLPAVELVPAVVQCPLFFGEPGANVLFQSRVLLFDSNPEQVDFPQSRSESLMFVGEFGRHKLLYLGTLPLDVGQLLIEGGLPLIGGQHELCGGGFTLGQALLASIEDLLDLAAVVGEFLRLLPEGALLPIEERKLAIQALLAAIELGEMDTQVVENLAGFVERRGIGPGSGGRSKMGRACV